MGGRSEGDSDAMAFIHAADATTWAKFLQTKLHSDHYRIQSYLHCDPNENYVQELFFSVQTCAVLITPSLLEPSHSMFWSRCAKHFNHSTVLLFLGVDQEDLRSALGPSVSELISSHDCLNVDGTQEAVSNALVKLIEVFESSELRNLPKDSDGGGEEENTEDIYQHPHHPRQQNELLRLMPEVLYEKDSREVLVVMEKEADGTLLMLAESCFGPPQHIVLKHVASSAYMATLPNDFMGKVDIMILSEDEHNLGKATVQVRSTMEQLHHLLDKETSPMTVLCRALGVNGTTASSETEEFDSMLAKHLAFCQFPTALANILHSDDQATGDQGTSRWPSLLHFAAEFDLTKVCEELLRFPGMIYGACTENCDGFFPCQLAEKNGFTALQKRLVQFVEDMRLRRSAADSGISLSENIPAPSPHSSHGQLYLNERPPSSDMQEAIEESSEDYVDMSGLKYPLSGTLSTCWEAVDRQEKRRQTFAAPVPCSRKVTDGYAKPRSFSEGCVKTPYAKAPSEARIAEEDSQENAPPPLKPKRGRAHSSACNFVAQNHLLGSDKRPDSSSSEASESEETNRHEEISSKSSTETLTNSECGTMTRSQGKGEEETGRESSQASSTVERPVSQWSNASSQSDDELPMQHPEADHDDSPVLRNKNTKRSKSMQDKISHFFRKIKPARRLHTSSESDLPIKGPKKPTVSSRQSAASVSSDPLGYASSSLKSRGAESERDSGAVCDEKNTLVTMRNKGEGSSSRNSGKRNGVSMQRRVSVRVQRAKNEDLSETPILPARRSITVPKETFVSFIR